MANDIVNTSGSTSGNQRMGNVIVNTGGSRANSYKKYSGREITKPVTDVAAKYDTRFDDPRYYNGDTAS